MPAELDSAEIVGELRTLLGVRLVAFIGGASDTARVRGWASGSRAPSAAIVERYRIALRAAQVIAQRDGPELAQVWFQGLNPALGDRSPAQILRDLADAKDADAVLDAALEQAAGA